MKPKILSAMNPTDLVELIRETQGETLPIKVMAIRGVWVAWL